MIGLGPLAGRSLYLIPISAVKKQNIESDNFPRDATEEDCGHERCQFGADGSVISR